jgi:hypothetical protein
MKRRTAGLVSPARQARHSGDPGTPLLGTSHLKARSPGRTPLMATEAAATPGGQGPLARLLATRGGTAAPEAPFVIEHREELIYMLCEAAELEHGIMCQYLFAAFSLRESEDEGLTADELAAVTRWPRGSPTCSTSATRSCSSSSSGSSRTPPRPIPS